jgi:hypothetical protein
MNIERRMKMMVSSCWNCEADSVNIVMNELAFSNRSYSLFFCKFLVLAVFPIVCNIQPTNKERRS